MALFSPEKLDVLAWSERFPLLDNGYLYTEDAYNKVERLFSDIEVALNKTPIQGVGFTSQGVLEQSIRKIFGVMMDFVDFLPCDYDEHIDEPFYLQMHNNALEYIATIDASKLTTGNTIGIEAAVTVSGQGRAYTNTHQLNSLSFADFFGVDYEISQNAYQTTKYTQFVGSFANIFKQCYDSLKEEYKQEASYEDYLASLLPEEFSVQKDVPLLLQMAQSLAELTIVVPLIEAAQGKELITNDHLTIDERSMKVAQALVLILATVITYGSATAAADGIIAAGAASGMSKAQIAARMMMASFLSDVASTAAFTVGDELGLPPFLTTVLALLSAIGSGKLASNFLLNGKINGVIPL